MTEYSAIVVVQTNQADQPTNLLALSEGDTISDEVLSRNIRDAASGVNEVSSTVYNNSGAWELGLDEATRRDIESVSGTVRDTSGDYTEASVGFRIFSGDIQASTSFVSGYIDDNRAAWEAGLDEATRRDIESVSGTVRDTSGDLTEASVGFRVFSGDIQASTSYVSGYIDDNRAAWEAGLDADTRADIESVSGTVRDTSGDYVEASVGFRVFSGDIQASTTYLSGYVDDLETSARNLSGLVDASTATLDGRVDDLDASTDRLFVFSGSVETSTADIDGVVTINSTRSITNQNRITNLETSTNRLFEFSGGVETSTTTLDGRVDDLDASTDRLFTFSGSVETSTADLSADLQASSDKLVTFTTNNFNSIAINAADIFVLELSTNRLFVFSGDVETSTTTLDGSVVALNASSDRLFTFSGDVETSTADLREAVDTPTSSIASGFGFVPDAPTKTLDSVAISGFGDGDTSGVSVFDGAVPVYSEELGRFNYLKNIAKPNGGYGVKGGDVEAITIGIEPGGQFVFADDSGDGQLLINTQDGFLSGTGSFDMSSLRTIKAGTGDFNTASAGTQVVETQLNVPGAALSLLDRGYRATTEDRFAVDGSGIGSDADNVYVVNGAGPFIYYETSTNGSVRNGANELGLGATPGHTVSSTPDSHLSGTIASFYDNSAYYRTVVSSTGVYEIQSMLVLSSVSEIDVVYNIKIDNVAIANLADTIVGITAPHYRTTKIQAVKFLNAGQEIRISLTAAAQHIIGAGSNLLIRRIG